MTKEANKNSHQPLISSQTIERVVEALVGAHSCEQIVLFGSYATGRSRWDSDLDLLIVWQTDLPPLVRALEMRRLLEGIDCPLGIVVYTPAD